MQKMGAKAKPLLTLLAVAGLIAVACWLRLSERRDQPNDRAPSIETGDRTNPPRFGTSNRTSVSPDIAAPVQALKLSHDRVASLKQVDALRRRLSSLGTEAASLTVPGWL